MHNKYGLQKETIALSAIIFVIFVLMYFLEMRNIGYAVQGLDELSSCQILKIRNSVYRLMQDLTTGSTCFLITADNVTLDLNNHVIEGDGDIEDYGVFVDGREGAIIKNGIIKNFNTGILLKSSKQASIMDNQLEHNFDSGLSLINGSDHVISDNLFLSNSYYGIKMSSSLNNKIVRNTIYENFDAGLFMQASSKNIISDNIITSNSWNGISLYKSNANLLEGNIIRKNSWNGISLVLSSKNTFVRNTLEGNIRGIYLFSGGENIFSDGAIINSSALVGSLYISNSNHNQFSRITIDQQKRNQYALSIISSGNDQAAHNFFQDVVLTNPEQDIYSRTGFSSSNFDNVFLNVNYDREALTDSEKLHDLERKWWLEILVVEQGKPIQAAVEIQDNFGNGFTAQTSKEGYFKTALTDYIKTPAKTDRYSYRINVIYNYKRLSKVLRMNENRVEVFEF